MALILEVTHADGARTRHRVNGETLTIGRGLANDVVLDDPYVDANHARVTLDDDGGALVEDLGSVNGLLAGTQRLVGPAVVGPGDVLRLGRTIIRFRDPNEAVSPALVDGHVASAVTTEQRAGLRFPTTIRARLSIVLLTLIAVAVGAWLDDASRSVASKIVSTTLGVGGLLALWSGLWSVASRIIVQQFRFAGHLAVASAVALGAMTWSVIDSWLIFVFPDAGVVSALSYVIAAALIATLVAGHMSLASMLPRRRQWRVGVVAAATVMGIGVLSALTKDDSFSDVPKYPSMLKPIAANLVPTKSIDQFEASTRKIKDEVDQLAKK
ncbi:MAG TPA: FHA domain-containing protein [Gemmatimonadaceae bacterium]|jgi:hypothetical protein